MCRESHRQIRSRKKHGRAFGDSGTRPWESVDGGGSQEVVLATDTVSGYFRALCSCVGVVTITYHGAYDTHGFPGWRRHDNSHRVEHADV